MLNFNYKEILQDKRKVYLIIIALLLIFFLIFSLLVNSSLSGGKESGDSGEPATSQTETKPKSKYSEYGEIADMKITLTFGESTEKIGIKRISKWFKPENKDGKITLKANDEAIKLYVRKLAAKYNTFSEFINFRTSYHTKVDLDNKMSGWILDEDYSLKKLKSIISKKKSVSLNLTDNSTASNKWWLRIVSDYSTEKGYGNSYIEVSIENQHMWVYKDGNIVLESDVITGNPNQDCATPTGAYRILTKEYKTILKGIDSYGTEYNTEVSYWLPFTEGIGFHDAIWQNAFGGYTYLSQGSNGCVNLPLDVAGSLYDIADEQMPVFIY